MNIILTAPDDSALERKNVVTKKLRRNYNELQWIFQQRHTLLRITQKIERYIIARLRKGKILQSNHYISAHLHTRWFLRSNLLIPSSQIIPGKNINPSWLLDSIHFSPERQRRLRYEESNSFFSGINGGGSWVEVYIYILSPSLMKIQK